MATRVVRLANVQAAATAIAARATVAPRRNCASAAARNEHDYIVVGAGSAGCVLTNRLSAAGNNVCLIEVGPTDNSEKLQMPLHYTDLFYDKTYNWNYYTVPQPQLENRRIYASRGKTLGGTSSINGMVYMRPNPLDFNRWVNKDNAYGWSYAETLPYFKKLENYRPNEDQPKEQLRKYRGFNGPLHIVNGKTRHQHYSKLEVNEAFLKAGQQAGLPFTHDANGYQQEGVSWYDATLKDGERMSTSASYLAPALEANRKHVNVRTGSLCTRLLFDSSNSKVVGVEVADVRDKRLTRIHARKEVIVSAGAFNSPQLLQLSGIGNATELKRLGVQPVIDLPGVGANYQDHVRLLVSYKCTPQPSHVMHDERHVEAAKKLWRSQRTGTAASNQFEVGAHFCTSDAFAHPNAQLHFLVQTFDDVPGVRLQASAKPVFEFYVNTQREHSRGHVTLRSSDPFEHPVIDPKYFDDERDVKELVDAFKFTRLIARQKAFDAYRKEEVFPGDAVATDEQITRYVHASASTFNHPSGTCKIGDIKKDRMAVVDPLSLRVFGVNGLRVVDASVMPSEISCNLNATIIMIAERASDMILGNKLLAPEDAPFYTRKQ